MFKKVAVLGAGTMGSGIAELFAAHGLFVSLYDPHSGALSKARERFTGLDTFKMMAEGTSTPSSEEAYDGGGCVRLTAQLQEAVEGADFVVEAGPEKLEMKLELFQNIAPFLGQDAIVASNTSTLSLELLSQGQPFADRIIIAHFFNPAVLIPLVEIVGLLGTRPGIIERTVSLLAGCGKAPVVLKKDCPGFIANRLQAAVMREACYLLRSGVADAEQIDRAMTEGPGLRWALNGPFAIADYGGLDIWEKVTGNLFPLLDNAGAAPDEICDNVRQGRLGFKSGGGFYEYGDVSEREQLAIKREKNLRYVIRKRNEEMSEA